MSAVKKLIDNRRGTAKTRRYMAKGSATVDLSWGELPAEDLKELIHYAAKAGGAIRFGMTSDGGALALGVYGDGDTPYTLYANSAEGMAEHIRGLCDVFEGEALTKK